MIIGSEICRWRVGLKEEIEECGGRERGTEEERRERSGWFSRVLLKISI
jgi:adenylosuccinate synthase